MKRCASCVAMCLLLCSMGWTQRGQKGGQEPQQVDPDTPTPATDLGRKPTLGPATGPAVPEGGVRTANATDPKKLARIHSLYIERIDNELGDKLVESLGKSGRFHIVTKPKEADATVRGSCLESRRLKSVHSEVFISDRSGASVWQDSIKRPFDPAKPPSLDRAVSDTADMVAEHLIESMREIGRK